MANNRNAHEALRVVDQLDINGRQAAGGDPHEIIGEVEVIYRSKHNGQAVFTRTIRRNDLLVTGAVFLSEKINMIRSRYDALPLDVKHEVLNPELIGGVHTTDTRFILDNGSTSTEYVMRDRGTLPYERVCGIMVGRGGCGETNNQVHRVYRTDLEVPGAIPFRTIDLTSGQEDLDEDTRKKYFMRTRQIINGKDCICYYGKRFLTDHEGKDREINIVWEDGTPVDPSQIVPGSERGKIVKTYTKYRTILDSKDIREYCRVAEGTTIRSIVNSVGLITGFPVNAENNKILTVTDETDYDGVYEFAMVRGMTTLNTEDYPLKDKESTMEITYRLYFV